MCCASRARSKVAPDDCRGSLCGSQYFKTSKLSGTLAARAFLGSAALLTILAFACRGVLAAADLAVFGIAARLTFFSVAHFAIVFFAAFHRGFAIGGLALAARHFLGRFFIATVHRAVIMFFSLSFVLLGRLVRTAGTRGLGITLCRILRNLPVRKMALARIAAPQQVARQREPSLALQRSIEIS